MPPQENQSSDIKQESSVSIRIMATCDILIPVIALDGTETVETNIYCELCKFICQAVYLSPEGRKVARVESVIFNTGDITAALWTEFKNKVYTHFYNDKGLNIAAFHSVEESVKPTQI